VYSSSFRFVVVVVVVVVGLQIITAVGPWKKHGGNGFIHDVKRQDDNPKSFFYLLERRQGTTQGE
jgi:hypothetical protein